MAKILTDRDMVDIISRTVDNAYMLDDAETYTLFLEDLGELITKYFGGMRGIVGHGPGSIWTLGFYVNENVPDDGGIYADYDTSVVWKDGKEVEGNTKVRGPAGQVWAEAPDKTWFLRDEPWPPVDVLVETCFASRGKEPVTYMFEKLKLVNKRSDGMSQWKTDDGAMLAFNPDFWRPMAEAKEVEG